MRNILLFTSSVLLTSGLWAQRGDNFEENYEPITKSLNDWDPVRGQWLSEALPAVIDQKPIPVRTFPENITPMEMLALVPAETRTEIANAAQSNQSDPNDGQFWTQMNTMVQSSNCSGAQATSINRRPARSYGDPHLVSYDGERFSFQAVGEFVLTKANNSRFEVQTRQRPLQDDFSLNTAVAMNVNGDRVCLYARDYPDNNRETPLRVNGQAVTVSGHYFLPNGGVVQRSGDSYIIDWPTGESVNARAGRTGGMPFYNVSVGIVSCNNSSYSGVLGNADGNPRNDFDGDSWDTPNTIFAGNGNDDWQQTRSVFVTRNFADGHRVTQVNSLFDYAPGQSTFTFTDRSYPRVVRTINDLDPGQRSRARQACTNAGIGAADMDGCIYDNAYLNIAPLPAPPPRQPVDPGTVRPVTPTVNGNPEPPVRQPVILDGPTRNPTGSTGTTRPTETKAVRGSTDLGEEDNNTAVPREPQEETRPVRSTFGSSTPASEPVRSTPTRSTPTRSTPTRSTPTYSSPTPSTPTRSTPTRSTPTRSTPTRSTPTHSSPSRSTPSRSTPSRSTPSPSRGGGRG